MYKIVMLQNKRHTDKIFTPEMVAALQRFGQVIVNDGESTVERVKELISGADIAVTSWDCPRLDREILDQAPDLKLVLHAAGSVKGIVSDTLWERGVRITCSAEAIGQGVAETALGLTITSLKNLWNLSQYTRQGEWDKGKDAIRELTDIKIGVVGGGRVGQHYIRLLHNFDVEILLYDPTFEPDKAAALGARKVDFEELLTQSDLISIHAPSIPETEGLFCSSALKKMKDDAILINTARGSVFVEADLVQELKKGRLFACLDVTDPEPPAADHPLRALPNVILTPHIAGVVNNGMHRIAKYVIRELDDYSKGLPMRSEVTKDMLAYLA